MRVTLIRKRNYLKFVFRSVFPRAELKVDFKFDLNLILKRFSRVQIIFGKENGSKRIIK